MPIASSSTGEARLDLLDNGADALECNVPGVDDRVESSTGAPSEIMIGCVVLGPRQETIMRPHQPSPSYVLLEQSLAHHQAEMRRARPRARRRTCR